MSTELTTPIKIEIPGIGTIESADLYLKSEADKVIAEKDAEIRRLKNGIAPKHSGKSLQERLNEVCEKHGVSTLQDLDWAFCESEKRYTKDCIESAKEIARHKYKRCLAMAGWCENAILGWTGHKESYTSHQRYIKVMLFTKWHKRWLELAEKFKPNSTAQQGKG
jgi:hypothetical protein